MRSRHRSTSRSRQVVALGLGLIAAAAYLAGAATSGHLSILARRPILDGQTPPAPYRWVKPPANLTAGNQMPLSKTDMLPMTPAGSAAGVISTGDGQAAVVFSQDAFPQPGTEKAVMISVKPLAPTGFGLPPSGYTILGNIYRVQATYTPSSHPAILGKVPCEVVLEYPPTAGPHHAHEILQSADGKTWTVLKSIDALQLLQLTAAIHGVGFFATAIQGSAGPPSVLPSGVTPTSGGGTGSSGGGVGLTRILVIAVIVIGVAIAIMQWAQRRGGRSPAERRDGERSASSGTGRGGGGKHRPPPRRPPPSRGPGG